MQRTELMYSGKAKEVYATDDADLVVLSYRDDATAGNGAKKGTIEGKGVVNNIISNRLFAYLAENGVQNHFVKEINARETVARRVTIVPLEVVVRNVVSGSLVKRIGKPDGFVLPKPIVEFYYKDDELGDPLINNSHIEVLDIASSDEINLITEMALKVNSLLKSFFEKINIRLVDFKLEFGRGSDGKIYLADEISPDTCRFRDISSGEILDKDLFRKDLGGEKEAYQEMLHRVMEATKELCKDKHDLFASEDEEKQG